jgi:hypothetical protein
MQRITGRIEVVVNGNTLLNKAGAKASGIGLSGKQSYELTPVMGDSGIHGFIEKPVPAQCEVTITDRDDISLDTLAQIREDGTVIFRAAGGGKVYTMANATCTRNLTITGGEGEVPVKFVGNYWTESTESVA